MVSFQIFKCSNIDIYTNGMEFISCSGNHKKNEFQARLLNCPEGGEAKPFLEF